MLRSLWQNLKDLVYDSVLSVFRPQEDIDVLIETRLLETGNVVYDTGDVPPEANARHHEFLSYEDAVKYVTDGGIPASCVTYLRIADATENGDEVIVVYVQEDTP